MKQKQFSEEQIIGILKEAEANAVVTELCRKHGMSSATYYAWKAKFGGLATGGCTSCFAGTALPSIARKPSGCIVRRI